MSKYALLSLVALNPAFIWIGKWGGLAWISGIFIFLFIIRKIVQMKKYQERKPIQKLTYSIFYILFPAIILWWFHLIIGFQLLIFFYIYWVIYSNEPKKRIVASKVVIGLGFYVIIRSISNVIIRYLETINPSNLSQFLINQSSPVSKRINYMFFFTDLYINFIFGLVGLFLFALWKHEKKKNKVLTKENNSIFETFFFYVVFILFTLSFYYIFTDFSRIILAFIGSTMIFKMRRIFTFITIPIAIFSGIGTQYLLEVIKKITKRYFKKISKNSGFIVILALVTVNFAGTTYGFFKSSSLSYNQNTIDSFKWIQENIPEGSLFLNDFQGQWIPVYGNYRITNAMTPSVLGLDFKTYVVFLELYKKIDDNLKLAEILSWDNPYNISIDYIYFTKSLCTQMEENFNNNDNYYSLYQNFTLDFNLLMFNKSTILSVIYFNSDVVIYKIMF
ncbi:MAG: hypothetical protein ACTSP3_00370 [Candidatus Heimdallarchaeaceae archaeon]